MVAAAREFDSLTTVAADRILPYGVPGGATAENENAMNSVVSDHVSRTGVVATNQAVQGEIDVDAVLVIS